MIPFVSASKSIVLIGVLDWGMLTFLRYIFIHQIEFVFVYEKVCFPQLYFCMKHSSKISHASAAISKLYFCSPIWDFVVFGSFLSCYFFPCGKKDTHRERERFVMQLSKESQQKKIMNVWFFQLFFLLFVVLQILYQLLFY